MIRAAHVLDNISTDKGAPAWRGKVRVLQRGPNLKSPVISDDVQNQVYDALLRNRRLTVTYNPRWQEGEKEYEINPLGLVLKDGITYLVCSMWDYPDIRLLTLHRILEAQILDKPATAPDGFNLDDQIIVEHADGRMLLTATVQDTSELCWWLLGFGDQVEVLEPVELRQNFSEIVSNMASSYARSE